MEILHPYSNFFLRSSFQCFQWKFMIKLTVFQSRHGFFLKMFSKASLWLIDVNLVIIKWISIRLHDEPMFSPILKLVYTMGIVMTLCWLHYDSNMFNCLYVMTIMYIYGELLMIDPRGSCFEYLNNIIL